MDSRTENLKAELKRLHTETAERVVCRRLDSLVGGPLDFRYCAECGEHRGHRPGALQCSVCDARDSANKVICDNARNQTPPASLPRNDMRQEAAL